ncbi:MAG TPA: signal peptide peptidase SppA [Tepidisphaeraceae bacterium]|jgi:protease-4|nr:signal peptide peptidase SppA [Tepidisphaeraceae bacterium]
MKAIFAAALLVAGGIAFADQKAGDATPTSTNTATVDNSTANPVGDKPSAPPENTPRDKKPDKADKPAAAPTNTPPEKPLPGDKNADQKPPKATEDKLPSPAELIKRIKAMDAEKAKKSKIAYFDLSTRPITEAPAGFSLFGDDGSMTLRSIIERMHQARDDKEIKGVLVTLGDGGLNFSQAQELRGALRDLTKAGKATYVYADGYDTDTYIMASGAKHVCMLEGGEIMIPGVGLEATFYKGLFDKIGIKADYVQIGEYKGADEEYTRTEASPELKGELTKLTSSLYDQIVNVIASSRNISTDAVKQMIDDTILTGPQAKEKGMVDDLTDQDSLRALISKDVGSDVDLVADYGRTRETAPDLSNPMNILSLLMKKPAAESNNPQIALIYAEGVIVDGEAGDGLFSEGGVGSETMRKAMRIAARDENIKAIVIRIDSPGGSALASEVMWQAVRHAAEKKPVIISVGSMAASGGYYLASAGDKIFADPSAIVGSIGVVGGKFVYKGVYDWAGVHAEAFSKGKNAGLFSSSEPWDDRQKLMVTKWMQGTYKQFTQRVMKTRGGKIKDIDKVARGRIFVASEAKALGMVDEIGGIEDALAYAAKDAGLDSGKYDVRIVPAPKSLGDLLMGGGPEAAFAFKPTIQLSPDSILNAAPPDLRRSIARELQMVRMLQEHPVVLMSPFNVEIH